MLFRSERKVSFYNVYLRSGRPKVGSPYTSLEVADASQRRAEKRIGMIRLEAEGNVLKRVELA